MKNLALTITAILIFAGAATLRAQNPTGGDTDEATHNVTVNIPMFALVDVEDGGADIILTPGISNEAGSPLDFSVASASDNSGYLNYTSVVGSSDGNNVDYYGNGEGSGDVSERRITVVTNGALNGTGVALQLVAASDAGGGAGQVGSPVAVLPLSSTTQNLITGIGSCYTGDGTSSGHNLTYSLVQTQDANGVDYGALSSGSYDVTITYTITD